MVQKLLRLEFKAEYSNIHMGLNYNIQQEESSDILSSQKRVLDLNLGNGSFDHLLQIICFFNSEFLFLNKKRKKEKKENTLASNSPKAKLKEIYFFFFPRWGRGIYKYLSHFLKMGYMVLKMEQRDLSLLVYKRKRIGKEINTNHFGGESLPVTSSSCSVNASHWKGH